MFNLMNIFNNKKAPQMMSKEDIAAMLNTSSEALAAFEAAYNKHTLEEGVSDNFFKVNAKQMAEMHEGITTDSPAELGEMIDTIVKELLNQTTVWSYEKGKATTINYCDTGLYLTDKTITNDDIKALPEALRPELTGNLMKTDTGICSSDMLLMTYKMYLEEKNPKKKMDFYNIFRQGLDIQDLDSITYEIIGTNPISMGYWLPKMVQPMEDGGFFKIPNTKIIKIPLTLLQMTRLEYMSHTRTTLDIVDEFCQKAFELDETKDYFIKTGTYSSKFDFRNARVSGAKEVRELGEYLLFIHSQALAMAHYDLSGRKQPVTYGVSTTNEWVVREFIEDKEDNMTIYHGLPLHTEYRVFVDFDTDEVLGIHPYWDPEVMKKRFGHAEDSNDPDMIHDYITYSAAEEKLMARYNANKDTVVAKLAEILPQVDLHGQWSIDIMQNGDDFWFIDMATAERSAFYAETVPPMLRRPVEENWLPDFSKR